VWCTKIEIRQNQRKRCAFRIGFITPPILATPVETLCPTSPLGYATALAGTVVATGPASANADYDNGAVLRGLSRCRWSSGGHVLAALGLRFSWDLEDTLLHIGIA
jgi:hypothetical protein